MSLLNQICCHLVEILLRHRSIESDNCGSTRHLRWRKWWYRLFTIARGCEHEIVLSKVPIVIVIHSLPSLDVDTVRERGSTVPVLSPCLGVMGRCLCNKCC